MVKNPCFKTTNKIACIYISNVFVLNVKKIPKTLTRSISQSLSKYIWGTTDQSKEVKKKNQNDIFEV